MRPLRPARRSHPELGVPNAEISVLRYRLVAEYEDEDENVFETNVDLAPEENDGIFSVTLPPEFGVDEAEVKFELLTREESFNQTGIESCPFELDVEDGDDD